MSIKSFPYHLEFKRPFKIASVERTGTDNLYLKFEKDEVVGWGEAVFPPYIPENQKSAINRLADLSWSFQDDVELFNLISENHKILANEPALACAAEACLLNWLANVKGISLADFLGLDNQLKPTSYTIGIGSNNDIKETVNSTPEATYFKLKVNEDEIERIVDCYTSLTDLPFVVDANQGFTNFEKANYWCEKLHELGVAYFEQPFHKADLKSHQILSNEVEIPIIADESFQRFEDLEKIKDSFDGINVKIIKTGGVLEAKKSLKSAKEYGLTTIVGCMSGSSVSINTASSLVSLADYVDLDGVYLIKNDPNLARFK